jgi:hypothetical protein
VGTGLIENFVNYRSGDLAGGGDRITASAFGYYQTDCGKGQPSVLAAFGSEISEGHGRWHLYLAGSASSAIGGKVRIGSTAVPTDHLEVQGFMKVSRTGTQLQPGKVHEIITDRGDFCLDIAKCHMSKPQGARIHFTNSAPNTTDRMFLQCKDSETTRAIIYANGQFGSWGNRYGAISDRRLTRDIEDAGSQLADIRAVRVRKFRSKIEPAGPLQIGVLAQEIQEVSPGLVFEAKVDGVRCKGVNYSILYMKALVALQELASEIDRLKEDVAKLKARKRFWPFQ